MVLFPVNMPLPTKIVDQVLPPIDIAAEFGDDPDVRRVDAHVRSVMQDALNAARPQAAVAGAGLTSSAAVRQGLPDAGPRENYQRQHRHPITEPLVQGGAGRERNIDHRRAAIVGREPGEFAPSGVEG